MSEHSKQEMKSACHSSAEWVLRRPCRTNRCKWVRDYIADMLKDPEFIEELISKYQAEYKYADVRSSFLADALRAYDEDVA